MTGIVTLRLWLRRYCRLYTRYPPLCALRHVNCSRWIKGSIIIGRCFANIGGVAINRIAAPLFFRSSFGRGERPVWPRCCDDHSRSQRNRCLEILLHRLSAVSGCDQLQRSQTDLTPFRVLWAPKKSSHASNLTRVLLCENKREKNKRWALPFIAIVHTYDILMYIILSYIGHARAGKRYG